MANWTELSGKLSKALKKYKYAALILLLGIALLLLPSGKEKKRTVQPEQSVEQTDDSYAAALEQRLSKLLSQIDGAGRVEVMLTLQTGRRTHYQTDTQTSEDVSEQTKQTSQEQKTVILSEGSAYDKAAVSAVEYPQFQGALILSEGADAAAVKLDLMQAVAALTGLSSSQITVVKLK